MIKVLQFVPTLGYGGVAQFILNYYKGMNHDEVCFDFITHGEVEDFHNDLINNGSKIYYIKSISKIGALKYVKQIKGIILSNKYDIIHIHTGPTVGLSALICRLYFKGKIICHAHTTSCPNKKHQIALPILRVISRGVSDRLLGCGEKACNFIFGKRAKYKIIHNAVSVERFQYVTQQEAIQLREELAIPLSAHVIGHVGLFCYIKNHKFLIEVFKQIYTINEYAYLVLVGNGELFEDIQRMGKEYGIADRIRCVGKQSNIPLYMKMFNVLALPSLFEGLPVVVVEAQASGLPCVISDVIDKNVDAGLGLVKFADINNVDQWVSLLTCNKKRAVRADVIRQLTKAGYELNSSISSLVEEYKILLSK